MNEQWSNFICTTEIVLDQITGFHELSNFNLPLEMYFPKYDTALSPKAMLVMTRISFSRQIQVIASTPLNIMSS